MVRTLSARRGKNLRHAAASIHTVLRARSLIAPARRKPWRVLLLLVAMISTLPLSSASYSIAQADSSFPEYTITDLGTFGGTQSVAEAINDVGDIVGSATFPAAPLCSGLCGPGELSHGFLYHNGTMQDLGTLGATTTAASGAGSIALSAAGAINALGQAVGEAQTSTNGIHAALFGSSTPTDLGADTAYSAADAVNVSGTVVGVAEGSSLLSNNPSYPQPEVPFVWTTQNGLRSLYRLGCGFRADYSGDGDAYGINNSGVIVGQAPIEGTPPNVPHLAFLCTPATAGGGYSAVNLGPIGSVNSAAYAINDKGDVVGKSDFGGGPEQATLWPAGGTPQELGLAPPLRPQQGVESKALAINDVGDIVGSYGDSGCFNNDCSGLYGNRAFIWRNGVMTDLNDLLPAGSPWTLIEATGINTQGQIVGQGLINGQFHAFLMTPKADVNITATGIEVTQGVQNKENLDLLVAGKKTYAIVHARADTHTVQGVTAVLSGQRNGVNLGTLDPIAPKINVVQKPQRGTIADSFLFELPPDWTAAGSLTLQAEVNPKRPVAETDYSDNTSNQTVSFSPAINLQVDVVNVSYPDQNAGGALVPAQNDPSLLAYTSQLYPVAQIVSDSKPEAVAMDFDPSLNVDTGCAKVLGWLNDLRKTLHAPKNTILYGFLPRMPDGASPFGHDAKGETDGCAFVPSGVATGTSGWNLITPHELSHAVGRNHVPQCDAIGQDNPPFPDPSGKVVLGTLPEHKLAPDDNDLGFNGSTFVEQEAKDIMTYCDSTWMSDYTYEALYKLIPGVGTRAQASLQNALSVNGSINFATETADPPLLARLPQSDLVPPLVPGPYHIRLFDAGGKDRGLPVHAVRVRAGEPAAR